MPLEPIPEMMSAARKGGYAIGYFESWSIESLQGVIDAAEETGSPVIIGFNGEFLSHAGRLEKERLALYGALGRAAAESANVAVGFVFNECAQDDWVREACGCGFNLVMPADPEAPAGEYRERVRDLAAYAHARSVAIEAELGELPCGAGHGTGHDGGSSTDPGAAAEFVAATGVDLLAVSVGNVHVLLEGRQGLDLRKLRAIRDRVPVPLALHGGSGIDSRSLHEAIALGVTKVNYGTYVKQRYLSALRDALDTSESNPHKLLGMGGTDDILVAGRRAVRKAVLERIDDLGCRGRS